MTSVPAVPTATYRLQLQPRFPFAAAEAAVPYLAELGVSHLHLSPLLEAVPGSRHGYDVTDHSQVRAELGGESGLRSLAVAARKHAMGLVVDIVPNHMSSSPAHNRQLRAVLKEGPGSAYAHWFDIDFEAQGGKVLLPLLGAPLGEVLGELAVQDGELLYNDVRLPLREGTEALPLPQLLDAQWYRLGWWRLARTELNYRRFFTVDELIGVRVEEPDVFEATHATVLRLVAEGIVSGLRVDHPDGLADPATYLQRLHEASGGVWTVVEKILADEERLPAGWPVAGTTGYDALRRLDGVLTDAPGATELHGVYRRFTAAPDELGGDADATARTAAERVLEHDLATELARLTRQLTELTAIDPALRDHAPWALRQALRGLLVRMPVYRPYTQGAAETALTEEAAREAEAEFEVPEEGRAVRSVRELLLGRHGNSPRHAALLARFAQVSSALRAKSLEDRTFYRYVPLLSANEVGGNPAEPALSPEEFHAHCVHLAHEWPAGGTVLSTHDTKRSADVRAVIAQLSQCPEQWAKLLAEVTERTTREGGAPAPDHQAAWAVWQTALGLGVPDTDRIGPAMLKHVREAGLRTSWTEPDARYEDALQRFVLAGPGGPAWKELESFAALLAPHTRAHQLAATLLQLTMPGVPELYQGTERDHRALVDPDNRAPIRLPQFLHTGTGAERAADSPPHDEKETLTRAVLRLRRGEPALFGPGSSYEPLEAEGQRSAHCLSFVRSGPFADPATSLTAVTRLSLRLLESGGWGATVLPLPPGNWRDVLDGREFDGRVRLATLFAERPVVLLRGRSR